MQMRASNQAVSVTNEGRKIAHPAAVEGNRPTRILIFRTCEELKESRCS